MTKTIPQLDAATLPVDPASLMEISIPGGGSRKIALANTGTGGLRQTLPILVSSADILGLFDTPVILVADPGAGKAVVMETGWITYIFGTTPYVAGGEKCGFVIKGQSFSNNLFHFSTILSQAEGGNGFGVSAQENVSYNVNSIIDNKGILFQCNNPYTDGDGTAIIGCTYRIFDLATGLVV